MKISEVKLIQRHLVAENLYSGEIDGRRGTKTNSAIDAVLSKRVADLPESWVSWSNKRKAVAYLQLLCRDKEIDCGIIDGAYGPQTESASELLRILESTGSLPPGFGDIVPILANPHDFPIERFEALNEYYGRPCEASLVKVSCPWTLYLDWEPYTAVKTISIHEKLSDSLSRILEKAFAHYGQEGIEEHGLHHYGGSYNCRKKRGSLFAWSTHAWGIAIDWFPSRNKLHWHSRKASLAHPDLDVWWELWEQEGWLSLGRSEDRDWMHVQAAKR